jgi:hypothetical protein
VNLAKDLLSKRVVLVSIMCGGSIAGASIGRSSVAGRLEGGNSISSDAGQSHKHESVGKLNYNQNVDHQR